jgi:hypothetical protein
VVGSGTGTTDELTWARHRSATARSAQIHGTLPLVSLATIQDSMRGR